jgi:hypothetical protein
MIKVIETIRNGKSRTKLIGMKTKGKRTGAQISTHLERMGVPHEYVLVIK